MTEINGIYETYHIMPQLQLHQLRVTAVAKQICDNLKMAVDEDAVIKACLLHDMGNIIKFDLTKFPEFLRPQGEKYWQEVKDQYVRDYGSDVHSATATISKELGVSVHVRELINAVGFEQAPDNAAANDYERKLCAYADMRVGPYGIISLENRLIDGALRYSGEIFRPGERQDNFAKALRKIEDQLFKNAKIKPADITDESVAPTIEELRTYEI